MLWVNEQSAKSAPVRGRTILAASTGGHLAQLHLLRNKVVSPAPPLWVTFDTAQSRSLLAGEDVLYIPYISPRDLKAALSSIPRLVRRFRRREFSSIVSTGAAISVPAFIAAALNGIPRTYIESVSRFNGPSLSGKIVSWIPRTRLYTQHARWARRRWKVGPSVLGSFLVSNKPDRKTNSNLRIFITLGTIKPFRFDRLVDMVQDAAPDDAELVWQLGVTSRSNLNGDVHEWLTAEQMDQEISAADVVVTHSGVGSALRILEHGKIPIMAARLAKFAEHVDDHQTQITQELVRRGLAIEAAADAFSDTALTHLLTHVVSQSSDLSDTQGQ